MKLGGICDSNTTINNFDPVLIVNRYSDGAYSKRVWSEPSVELPAMLTSDEVSSGTSDDIVPLLSGEPPSMSGMTLGHNNVRSNVSPKANPPLKPLLWDDSIAAEAQSWANNCRFIHGGHPNEGQNIYSAGGFVPTPSDVVNSWASEASFYNYNTNSCASGKQCGHYTQIVWRSTTKLGCGMAYCKTNSPIGKGDWYLVVCNYKPPGNYRGQKPY